MERTAVSQRALLITAFELLLKGFGPQHWWPGETPFEVMVGAVLTQNTAWRNVEKAIANLKKADVLDPFKMHSLNPMDLAELIRPTGFYNLKEKRLRNLLHLLGYSFDGNPESMGNMPTYPLRKILLSMPGIGPETADSILLYALEKPVFVVDAYTKRVMDNMNIAEEGVGYHEVQSIFMENLPADVALFNEFHALFVKLAKDNCRKKAPLCPSCPLVSLCPKGLKSIEP